MNEKRKLRDIYGFSLDRLRRASPATPSRREALRSDIPEAMRGPCAVSALSFGDKLLSLDQKLMRGEYHVAMRPFEHLSAQGPFYPLSDTRRNWQLRLLGWERNLTTANQTS